MEQMTAKARYDRLTQLREPYIRRAEEAAELTIPALFPREGTTGHTDLPSPSQSVGARGVNNLSAKLSLALFPPGGSFFKFTLDEYAAASYVEEAGDPAVLDELTEALARAERVVADSFEVTNGRAVLAEYLVHLVTTGNACLDLTDPEAWKFHPLSRFVVVRDLIGRPVEVVIKEPVSRTALEPEVIALIANSEDDKAKDESLESVDVFTHFLLKGKKWQMRQEVAGLTIPDTEGTFTKDEVPVLVNTWKRAPGEHYGRGHVEEYIGDLRSLEALSESLVDFAGAASRLLYFVNPGGVTRKKDVAEADSGDVVDGDANDVTQLQAEKFADFKVTKETADAIEHRLEQSFLLHTSIQRNAERVTAEEVRLMAGELEQAFGGIYSTLSMDLQYPLVVRLKAGKTRGRKIPKLPKTVKLKVVTGIDGLGRSSDLMKLDTLVAGIAQTFGPEAVAQWVNVGSYVTKKAAALGIATEGLIRSQDEVTAQMQEAQKAELARAALPASIQAQSRERTEAAKLDAAGTQGA